LHALFQRCRRDEFLGSGLGIAFSQYAYCKQYEKHSIDHGLIPIDTTKLRSIDGKSMVKTVYLYALLNGLP
jgi:hypothetical protein